MVKLYWWNTGSSQIEYSSMLWRRIIGEKLKCGAWWKKSLVNYIFNRGNWQLNLILTTIFIFVIVRKEGPASSCSRTVMLSFLALWLRINQFLFLDGAGIWDITQWWSVTLTWWNWSAVRVWSILKPNVNFSTWIYSPAVIQWEWKDTCGIDARGKNYYTVLLGANSGRIWNAWIQIVSCKWKTTLKSALSTNKEDISNATIYESHREFDPGSARDEHRLANGWIMTEV